MFFSEDQRVNRRFSGAVEILLSWVYASGAMAMAEQSSDAMRVQFGVFEADLKAGELRRSGVRVRLQSQPFKLLAALLKRPGEVVTREELQQQLWGTDTTVDFDHSLGIAVNKLRDALGDRAENPRFVETLAKRGYRFIAPVKGFEEHGLPSRRGSALTQVAPAPKSTAAAIWLWVAGAIALACLGLVLALLLTEPSHESFRIVQVTYSGHLLQNDPIDTESFSSSVSDGTRLYFSDIDNGNPVLAVALAANGEISHFHLPSEIGAPLIGALAPDGSKLIVHGHLQVEPEQPLWIVPTLGGDARRVPNVLAHDATWMPDGQHLLIASGNDLTVVGTDGSEPRRLISTQGLAFWLRWAPDGKHLRFTLRQPKSQTTELWEVGADGSNPHPLLAGWSQPTSECCGSWTPDGEYFVFQSAHGGSSGSGEIWALREHPWYLSTHRPMQITNGPLIFEAPGTSPGNHLVHFIGVDPQIELLQAMPRSSEFTSMGQNLSAAELAEYSPDGKWVAWLNASDGSLWRSRADGSERIELTTPPMRIFSMKWSPDNRRLALMAEEPGMPWKLYTIDSEGGKPGPLLSEDRNEADPDWSADGQSMVFGRPPDRMDNGQPKAIYLLNLQSRKMAEIPGSTGLFSPRLSPDGRYIAAIRLDQKALLLFDRTAQQWTTIAIHGVGDPTWSHDSRYLYFQDFLEAGKPIYRIAIPAGKPEQVATIANLRPIAATDYRLIGLAPGDLPIVSARTSTVNLYSVDLNER
jgi:DNA-binding winged helix-turn-helix (wHTH) protein/Tol biopolymer transport system component